MIVTFINNSVKRFRRVITDESQTEAAASKRRVARAGLSSVSMATAKTTQIVVSIIIVPIILNYLGKEGYGLLITVASVTGWFGISDLGIGLGLKNALVEAYSANDRKNAQSYVSTAFVGLTIVAFIIMLLFFGIFPFLPWEKIFNITGGKYAYQLRALISVSALIVFIRIPLNLVGQIYSAEQSEYISSIWAILASVFTLGALVVFINLDLGIVAVVVARDGMTLIATAAGGAYLFFIRNRWLSPCIGYVKRAAWQRIWSSGSFYFIVQISMIAIYQSDIFLVNYFIFPEEVPVYSLPARLYLYVTLIIGFITGPFWPAFGEAMGKRHWGWIKKTVKNLTVLSVLIAIVACAILSLFGQKIILLWTNGIVNPPVMLLFVLGLYTVVRAWTQTFSIALGGLNIVTFDQVVAVVAQGILNIVLSIILVRKMGVLGIALGSLISYSITSGWYIPLKYYWSLNQKMMISNEVSK